MGSMPAQQDPSPEPADQQSAAPKAVDLIDLIADPTLSGYEFRGGSLPDLMKRPHASSGGPAAGGEAEPDGANLER